ncbi:MAG TPA: aldo/keto reductase [Steroidobacteraceae bacterium]|nr:aldo/keto reductase [Steroidobacteraceae bacterium]
MERRRLGHTQIHTAPLAFGGNVFGWTLDEAASFRMLDEFTGGGFDFIDTADVYSRFIPGHVGGESETLIGKWLKARNNRQQVVIATKAGMDMGDGRQGLSKAYLLRAVEASLRRLQTDYIDLFQSHVDDEKTPLEETLGAYEQLIRSGKVRAIGASNYKAPRLAAALDVSKQRNLPRYESLQPLYNLYDRAEFEKELLPVCTKNNVGVITYFSLASGFLTGKYRSQKDLEGSSRARIVGRYLTPRGDAILAALDQVAAAHQSTPAAVSLAWLIARPGVTAAIASATSSSQLQTLFEATRLRLDAASMDALDKASAGT